MPIYSKSEVLLLNLAGHEVEIPVEISYVVEPDGAVEILAVRRVIEGETPTSCMLREGFLPTALVDNLEQDIADELSGSPVRELFPGVMAALDRLTVRKFPSAPHPDFTRRDV
jgi:hypothetical protein